MLRVSLSLSLFLSLSLSLPRHNEIVCPLVAEGPFARGAPMTCDLHEFPYKVLRDYSLETRPEIICMSRIDSLGKHCSMTREKKHMGLPGFWEVND